MPPPDDGNEALPFTDLLHLERINNSTFRGTALPFRPGADLPRAVGVTYGGHVFAQAAWAAAQTVPEGHLLYNVSGNFFLPGAPHVHFTYTVQEIRNGRSSSTRIVHATQETRGQSSAGIVFTSICSFKTAETSPLDVQANLNLWETYSEALRPHRTPATLPPVPGMDVPWYLDHLAAGGQDDAFPGLEMRQPDMSGYNASKHPLDRRQLMFYRPWGVLPQDNPNLHLCAHLYASDRNGLYIIAKHLDIGDVYTQMGTLTHTVVFHGGMEGLMFGATDDRGSWFCREDWTDRAAGGRMMFHSRIWGSGGKHVATGLQDGMTRTSKRPEATREEVDVVRRRMAGWKAREKL